MDLEKKWRRIGVTIKLSRLTNQISKFLKIPTTSSRHESPSRVTCKNHKSKYIMIILTTKIKLRMTNIVKWSINNYKGAKRIKVLKKCLLHYKKWSKKWKMASGAKSMSWKRRLRSSKRIKMQRVLKGNRKRSGVLIALRIRRDRICFQKRSRQTW